MSKCADRLKSDEIKKALFEGRDVPNYLVDEIVNAVERIKQEVDANPNRGTLTQRVSRYLEESASYRQVEIAKDTLDVTVRKQNLQHINQPAFSGKSKEGIMSLFVRSKYISNNGLLTTESRAQALMGDWFNGVFGALEQKKLLEPLMAGASNGLDLEISKAVYALEKGMKVDGVSDIAHDIAQVIHNYGKKQLADSRAAGIAVRDIGARVSMQTHSPEAMLAQGFDQWSEFVNSLNFDKEKLFGEALGDATKEREILQGLFQKATTGELEDAAFFNAPASRNMAAKLEQARSLTFLDAESEDAYRKAFGGKSLLEQLLSEMQSKSKKLAFIEQFGSDPKAGLLEIIERQAKKLEKEARELTAAGDAKGAAAKISEARDILPNPAEQGDRRYSKEILDQFTVSTGANKIVAQGGEMVARIENGIQTATSLSLLGAAGAKSLTNVAQASARVTDMSGKNLLASNLSTLQTFIANTRFYSTPEGKQLLMDMGITLEDTLRNLVTSQMVGVEKVGAKSLTFMSKANMMHAWTESGKIAFADQFAREMGKAAGKKVGSLSPRLRSALGQMGWEDSDLLALRDAVQTTSNGRTMMTPKAIYALAENASAELVARAKSLKMTPKQYVREMGLRYSQLLNDGAMYSSTTAGEKEARTASTMLGITGPAQSGTVSGALSNIMTKFKSFSFQAYNNALASLHSAPNAQALERGVIMSEGLNAKSFTTPAYMLTSTTALYYLATAMQDIARGKNPKDPTKVDTWVDSMLQSGMGSLYADLSTSALKSGDAPRAIADYVAGPTLSRFADVGFDLVRDAKNGKVSNRTKRDATRAVRTSILFQNAPIFKQGLDYLQLEVLQKSLDPGGYQKDKQMKKKYDTQDRLSGPWDNK